MACFSFLRVQSAQTIPWGEAAGPSHYASFKLFSQWPEHCRQRTFPASVQRLIMTRSGPSPTWPAMLRNGYFADIGDDAVSGLSTNVDSPCANAIGREKIACRPQTDRLCTKAEILDKRLHTSLAL
jgi:hypothetical protein